jgi:hypothetical protein
MTDGEEFWQPIHWMRTWRAAIIFGCGAFAGIRFAEPLGEGAGAELAGVAEVAGALEAEGAGAAVVATGSCAAGCGVAAGLGDASAPPHAATARRKNEDLAFVRKALRGLGVNGLGRIWFCGSTS